MCLSPNINYKKLQNIYVLRPYYGLKKTTPLEKEQMRRANVLLSTFGKPRQQRTSSSMDQNNMEHIIHYTSDDYSDRVFMRSPTVSQTTNQSLNVFLDEDPFDYDIVNIDVSLLTIGRTSSTDYMKALYIQAAQRYGFRTIYL
ncbi:Pas pac sensor hybrid histidine kinase [Operophtera brumata]|uniref:Pas pac sensor hybrid histidine kinase n=1 Tax=Operophtera brumata TaxID=104452 RepID=A0A0L7LIN8_OPEBR|nr:Pas pac sensor hybrid histidine kinase [Operophtera brumata]